MIELAETPEAEAIAGRFGVPPDIHKDDFMYVFHLGRDPALWDQVRPQTLNLYFSDGAKSAAQMDELVAKFHPEHGRRRLALFEFASGYGCVSRHLKKLDEKYDLLSCDIHDKAAEFLTGRLNVKSLLSRPDPRDLQIPGKFDVAFALSFFTHMPDRTWGRWLAKLLDALADDGILIFTAHGRATHDHGGRPPLEPDGHWFGGASEQQDLPLEDYRTMIVTPAYVFKQLENCPHTTLSFYQEAFWWGRQDVYIIRKIAQPYDQPRPVFDPPIVAQLEQRITRLESDNAALRQAIDIIHASRSWRVTEPLRTLGRMIKPGTD